MTNAKLYLHPSESVMYLTNGCWIYEKREGHPLEVSSKMPDCAIELKAFNDGLLADNYERIAVLAGGQLLTCTFAAEFLAVKKLIGAKVWYHKLIIDKFFADVSELTK